MSITERFWKTQSIKLGATDLFIWNCTLGDVDSLPVLVTLREVSLETVFASIRRTTRRTDVRHSLVDVLRRENKSKTMLTILHSSKNYLATKYKPINTLGQRETDSNSQLIAISGTSMI